MPKLKSNLSTGDKFGKLPVKVSQSEFSIYIRPHLRFPTKGLKPKLSYYKIFNYILHVLHTGIQWDELKLNKNDKLHWSIIYKWHLRWSKNGSYENLFLGSVDKLTRNGVKSNGLLLGRMFLGRWLSIMKNCNAHFSASAILLIL